MILYYSKYFFQYLFLLKIFIKFSRRVNIIESIFYINDEFFFNRNLNKYINLMIFIKN